MIGFSTGLQPAQCKGRRRWKDSSAKPCSRANQGQKVVDPCVKGQQRVRLQPPPGPEHVVDYKIREFILDSGASIHIGQEDQMAAPEDRIRESENPMTLQSANGPIRASKYVESYLPALGHTVALTAAECSPGALSLGNLCRSEGLSFYWEAWQKKPRVFDRNGV